MNKLIIIVFLLNASALISQTHQNLVYNGSFEQDKNGFNLDANNCTNPYGDKGHSVTGGSTLGFNWEDQKDYWSEVYGWYCPEKRDLCLGVGSADILCIENPNATLESRSGLIYATGTNREFITQPLREMLNPLSLYYIEFYHWSTSIEQMRGIRFSEDRPKQCGSGSTNLQDDLDIKFSENTNLEYKKITMYYKPQRFDHKWMTIGLEGNDRFTIDDIRIFEVGDDKCANGEWQIQNTDLYTWAYNASDKIIAGSNVSSNYYAYNGDVTVKSGNSVWFKAGNQVILEPGFSTEDGAYFETIIEPGCSPFDPCSNFKPSGQDYVNCGSNTTVIGPAVVEDYMTYSWSPSTYLDDPNIANPTFTPPPSGSGNIQYTLTMTPLCGGFVTSFFPLTVENVANIEYNVQYFSNPDPVPSFTVNSFDFDKCSAGFGIDVNSNTRSVLVEITNVQTGAIWFQQQYEMMNYACCNFNWSSSANIPDVYWNSFNSCANYNIKIKTNNWCNETVYYEENLLWEQETSYQLLTPLGNIITPASTPGQNDWFVINATGINSTLIYVYNRWGTQVFSNNYTNYCQKSQSGKLWSGQCNGNLCFNECVNEGWFYYVLFVYPCSGGIIQYSGDIYVNLNGNNSNNTYCENLSQKNSDLSSTKETHNMDSLAYSLYLNNFNDKENINDIKEDVSLFPNPSTGLVTLNISDAMLETVNSIVVYDALGRIVYNKYNEIKTEEQIDLNVANGVYTVIVSSNSKTNILRCVIQK